MRFTSYINNQKCIEWELNANQGALFDLLNQASSWAKEVVIDGTVYYWVSRNIVIDELPLFYSKPDTVYRHFVEFHKKGLIEYRKIGEKDLIRLTEKGKSWNEINQAEIRNSSDSNPTLGNKSESTRIEIRNSSDSNPTDHNTNYKNTNDHIKKTTQKKTALLRFEPHFEKFWTAGMRKVGKPQALKSFKAAYESYNAEYPLSLDDFTEMLVDDVIKRNSLRQFGFDKLHPTTYLNNWRWLDDYGEPEAHTGGNDTQKQFGGFPDDGSWSRGRSLNVDPNIIPEALR